MNNRQETTDHFNSLLGKSATNVMDRLRRYLLGDESDDGREEIELALIADGRVSDVLALVEDELTDAYVAGELNATDKDKFERNFLISERRRIKTQLSAMLLKRPKKRLF